MQDNQQLLTFVILKEHYVLRIAIGIQPLFMSRNLAAVVLPKEYEFNLVSQQGLMYQLIGA